MSEHISVTQMAMFLRCPRQYRFRYLEGFKVPPRASMVRGSSFHKANETNLVQKIETKRDLPIDEVKEVFSSEFDARVQEVELQPDENAGEIKDAGLQLVEAYHTQLSPKVQPVAVERAFEIEIQGQPMTGVIDLETENCIHETKTTSKSASVANIDHQLQLCAYAHATDKETFQLDYAVDANTKKPARIESFPLLRRDLPITRFASYVEEFLDALQKGSFPPCAPGNWSCSDRWCGYWNICKCGGQS